MIRKSLLALALILAVSGLPAIRISSTPTVLAASATTDSTGNLASPEFTFPLGTITPTGIKQSNWAQKGVNYFAERAITIMATLAGSVAVLMLVLGGFQMIVSTDDDAIKKGKQKILFTLIGLAAVFGAYILVTTVQILINSIYG